MSITVDSFSRASIKKTATNYTFSSSSLLYYSSLSCLGVNYDLIRIEAVLKTYSSSPVIRL